MDGPLDPPDAHVLSRPAAPEPLAGRVRAWLVWVGPGRVVGTAVVVLAVLAAAYWLVKPPPATTESRLPFATSTTAAETAGPEASPSTSGAAPRTSAPAEMVVHVAGAVARSGVYRVPAGSRVVDVVEVAGGLAADAQPDAINLAAPVTDGERVYVPHVGETVTAPVPASSAAPAGPIDLNTATADQLDELPGIGPATAAAIVAHREQFGPFGSVDDLADVKGIGPAKIEVLRGLVTV